MRRSLLKRLPYNHLMPMHWDCTMALSNVWLETNWAKFELPAITYIYKLSQL